MRALSQINYFAKKCKNDEFAVFSVYVRVLQKSVKFVKIYKKKCKIYAKTGSKTVFFASGRGGPGG